MYDRESQLGRSKEAAQAPKENDYQSHDYKQSEEYQPPQNEHEQAPDDGKGARGDRSRSTSSATAGHHVKTSKSPKRDGGADPVRDERAKHVQAARDAAEAGFDAARKPANAAWRKKVAAHKRVAGNRKHVR